MNCGLPCTRSLGPASAAAAGQSLAHTVPPADHTGDRNVRFKYKIVTEMRGKSYAPPGPHLGPHRVWQEAAHFPDSLLNLGFCRIFLQDAVNVRHSGLTNLTVATNLKACLVQCNWGGNTNKSRE